jgi:hypothetical protein
VLVIIILTYAVIIGFGGTVAGGPGRLLVLGYLLWYTIRVRYPGRISRHAAWVGAAVAFAAAIAAAAIGPATVASGLVGGASLALTAWVIVILARMVLQRPGIDTVAVVGVLAVYLLLALLFASVNQLFAAFDPDGYLHGVTGLPSAADQLYFSVVTMATVGYGDIVPGSQIARSVVVVEALTGQLYLVSVVATVVAGWDRRGPR